jgi:hypothetical protein
MLRTKCSSGASNLVSYQFYINMKQMLNTLWCLWFLVYRDILNRHTNEIDYCKTNTIPIFIHQMRISTNQVSSVTLMSKKLEIRKKTGNYERADKNQTECYEIDRSPSKDIATHEGDNSSF